MQSHVPVCVCHAHTRARTLTHRPIPRKAAYSWNAVSCGLQRLRPISMSGIYHMQSKYQEYSGGVMCTDTLLECFIPFLVTHDTRESGHTHQHLHFADVPCFTCCVLSFQQSPTSATSWIRGGRTANTLQRKREEAFQLV